MNSSSFELPPHAPLKTKLFQVKNLLDEANQRLQEEKSKCEIFTTKTSASGGSNATAAAATSSNLKYQNGNQTVPSDLLTTISDISTLKSVLSCPIFNRIVNVTDSLDKLSYQLNLHPSIGASDININANGELILAPPIEPTSFNNFINSQLDDYSERVNNASQITNPILVQQNLNNSPMLVNDQHILSNNQNSVNNSDFCQQTVGENVFSIQSGQANLQQSSYMIQNRPEAISNSYVPWTATSRSNMYDNEKLVSNGINKNCANKQTNRESRVHEEGHIDENPRLYNPNGQLVLHHPLENVSPRSNNIQTSIQTPIKPTGEQSLDSRINDNGYSNEMYNTAQELNQPEFKMVDNRQPQLDNRNQAPYAKNNPNYIVASNGKPQNQINNAGAQYNRRSCSPSTSAGSTVRLADADCDSGASSYQSQNAKGTPYSSYPYKTSDQITDGQVITMPEAKEDCVDSMEQDLNDNLYPDMEKIQVTLEKENNSLGITIAGYICEKEEISGIFIKSITPNSPADRSGKIRALDQIFAVNGKELLGFNNQEAVDVLKRAGKVVRLELMRHLADAKYRKLETALAHATPTPNASSKLNGSGDILPNSSIASSPSNLQDSQTRSSIPVSVLRENYSPVKQKTPIAHRPPSVQVYNAQQTDSQSGESSFKQEPVFSNQNIQSKTSTPRHGSQSKENLPTSPDGQSQIPVAAQRGGTNKVIETKQGARNTIDIRSPACQTTTSTYVNKIVSQMESCENSNNRFQIPKSSDAFVDLIRDNEPEWEKETEIIELHKDTSQGLGFSVKEYANPKDQNQSIIMITSLTPGGIAERDGRLSFGDLLIFVDDIDLRGGSLQEAVKALKKTNGQVRLGVLKLKRD